jgi:Zn-dependent protease
LPLLTSNPTLFIIVAAILIISLTIHEFAHALAADKLGDSTPRYMGRLTLNPMAHLDPMGSLMILLLGFGWGKPVMVNSQNFKNPRKDSSIVAFAGPLSNILLAALLSIIFHFAPFNAFVASLLHVLILFNLRLAFFNLLPVHPLDGFNVVYGLLPLNLAWQWQDTARYGIFILLILIATSSIGFFVTPLVDFSLRLLGF